MKIIDKWKRINPEKRSIFVLLMILLIGSIIIIQWNNYKQRALTESAITWGVIDDITLSKGGYTIDVHFCNTGGVSVEVNNVEPIVNCLDKKEIGDSVTVRYSLKDNSIAQIIHCYWNSKLKNQ